MLDGKHTDQSLSSGTPEFLRFKISPQRVRFLTMNTYIRIRKAREAKRISQGELARRLGISRSAVSQWESENGTQPDGENLLKCALELDVTPEWIQFGDETPSSSTTVSKLLANSAKLKTLPIPKMSQISKWIANPVIDETYEVRTICLGEDVPEASFLYEVTSNAMINMREMDQSIFPGELAIIDPTSTPNPGEFVLVEYGQDDYRIRRYERDGKVEYVEASNAPPSEQKTVIEGKIKIVGVVLITMKDRRIKK